MSLQCSVPANSACRPEVSGAEPTAERSPERGPEAVILPRRKVRVLFINDTARNGGPGRSLYYILKFLDPSLIHRAVVLPRAGVIATLLASGGVADDLLYEPNLVENPIEPWNRAMMREDFEAPLALRSVRFAGNIVRGAWSVVRLTSLVQRGQFDLIYCNGTNADFAGGALARTTGIPALWHVRYTSLPRAVVPFHNRLAASVGVRRILCVSKASAALFPHCAEKTRVVHNALDVEEFNPRGVVPALRTELGIPERAVVFGSQGRILRRKGYVEMIRAAKIALDQMSTEERVLCRFVILGDTPEDLRPDHLAECKALVRELALVDSVLFLGFRIDVKPLVADFDVAVVPSVYADPLPRSVIESMALAKPVIAFDVGGVAEMLKDGATGALVRGSRRDGVGADVEGLAAEFLRYLRNPELRRRQGEAARARIVEHFDGAAQARKIQNEIVTAAGVLR
jgi:glycosyltransferase involved in cell wall biosynthesis